MEIHFVVHPGRVAEWLDCLRRVMPRLQRVRGEVRVCQEYRTVNGQLCAPWLLSVERQAETMTATVQAVREAFMWLTNAAVDEPVVEDFSWVPQILGGRSLDGDVGDSDG